MRVPAQSRAMPNVFNAGNVVKQLIWTRVRPHENLPKGTETAVVYYLPQDGSQGFLDSSFVLNRSAEVEGGVLLAVTLVFEGKHLRPEGLVQAGRERLKDLLRSLDITVVKDSQGRS